MKFSTRSTYGLRAMIILAQNWRKGSVSLSKIAQEAKISQKYLERLFACFKKRKLVSAEKGAGGGYKLIRHPSRVTALDVINAVEGEVYPFHCVSGKGKVFCNTACDCGVPLVLTKIQSAVVSALGGVKLSDLI